MNSRLSVRRLVVANGLRTWNCVISPATGTKLHPPLHPGTGEVRAQRIDTRIVSARPGSTEVFIFYSEPAEALPQHARRCFRKARHSEQPVPRGSLGPIEMEVDRNVHSIYFRLLEAAEVHRGNLRPISSCLPSDTHMDDLMQRLDISLGAASQGLKALRSVGAVKAVYSPGERRDHSWRISNSAASPPLSSRINSAQARAIRPARPGEWRPRSRGCRGRPQGNPRPHLTNCAAGRPRAHDAAPWR